MPSAPGTARRRLRSSRPPSSDWFAPDLVDPSTRGGLAEPPDGLLHVLGDALAAHPRLRAVGRRAGLCVPLPDAAPPRRREPAQHRARELFRGGFLLVLLRGLGDGEIALSE